MEVDGSESSPATIALSELDRLRSAFREALETYATRIDTEILEVKASVEKHAATGKLGPSKLRDLRDMLTLLRNTQIKAEKGRRKDIKKIDSLVGDLQMLVERW